MSKQELLGRERRWALPVAVTIALVIVLEVAGFILLQSANLPTGSRLAPVLRAVDPVSSKLLFAAIMRGVGFALLAIPLAYLFKAASARDSRVRSGLIAAVIAGPVFLAISLILQQVAINDAASQLLGKLPVAHPESVAKDLQSNSTLLQISLGMALAGTIGFLAGTDLHGATGDAGGTSDPLLGEPGSGRGDDPRPRDAGPRARPARHPGADDLADLPSARDHRQGSGGIEAGCLGRRGGGRLGGSSARCSRGRPVRRLRPAARLRGRRTRRSRPLPASRARARRRCPPTRRGNQASGASASAASSAPPRMIPERDPRPGPVSRAA